MKPHHYPHHEPAVFIIDDKPRSFAVELTVMSAEGLDAAAAPISCSPFPRRRRLRPFASLTTAPPELWELHHDGSPLQEYRTGVNCREGQNPTWGDLFRVPVGSEFFGNAYSCLYLCVYDLRSGARGRRLLGWCQIPAGDFGSPLTGAVRHLSYRLRDRDATRGQGIVNVEVRVEGPLESVRGRSQTPDTWRAVIGYPVGLHAPPFAGRPASRDVSRVDM
ncbi:hypothetical protein CRG98_014280 [Punica granatum]|uniref:C2 domain-containing protein n=1 Tax=Punica granatum TaxID=22663 RepID=A0A2I0KC26_PUNGR|nr:hypothetical protein CRG98_014280 [Punica granatum]